MAKKSKPKKRGVKPGTKREPYKKKGKKNSNKLLTIKEIEAQLANIEEKASQIKQYAPAPVLTLCGQLEDSILLLEQRISNAIAKINSLV